MIELFAFIGVLILVTVMLILIGVFIDWVNGDYISSTVVMTMTAGITVSLIIMYLIKNGGM